MINIQSIRNCCAPLSTTALWIFAEHHTMWVNVLVITRTNSLVGGVAVRADDGGAILVNHVKIDDNVIPLEKGNYLSRELSIWRARNEHTSRLGESRAPVEDFQANGGGDGMVMRRRVSDCDVCSCADVHEEDALWKPWRRRSPYRLKT
ncbi:hypothetical protein J8273_8006 [Carpediemonas membranifera]|uniref:Uncharacterized protein n=1 Tax=Carpediemonas membranifera TaxID=201153 RepID=A0A8J6DZM9_9EUKA|nr:hypothetical protein J8273_8006 [Carpediemonas membranifera]|eukprot:KAG9390641.1 hypothetical protein J8273_8006 [Carpediemonas membranifera]